MGKSGTSFTIEKHLSMKFTSPHSIWPAILSPTRSMRNFWQQAATAPPDIGRRKGGRGAYTQIEHNPECGTIRSLPEQTNLSSASAGTRLWPWRSGRQSRQAQLSACPPKQNGNGKHDLPMCGGYTPGEWSGFLRTGIPIATSLAAN